MKTFGWLFGLVCFTHMVTSISIPRFVARSVPELQHIFSLKNLPPPTTINCGRQWLGADVAKSILLNTVSPLASGYGEEKRYLWLWGDTLIGKFNTTYRNWTTMPRNSVGFLSVAANGSVTNRSFHWGHYDKPPSPTFSDDLAGPLFQLPYAPDPIQEWLWPVAAAVLSTCVEGRPALHLVASHCNMTHDSRFYACPDTQLISVQNMGDIPEQWNYSMQPIPLSSDDLLWDLDVVMMESWIYVFGRSYVPHYGVVVMRIPSTNWHSHTPSFSGTQFLCGNATEDGVWMSSVNDTTRLKHIPKLGFANSIKYNNKLKLWYAFIPHPSHRSQINISVAPALLG